MYIYVSRSSAVFYTTPRALRPTQTLTQTIRQQSKPPFDCILIHVDSIPIAFNDSAIVLVPLIITYSMIYFDTYQGILRLTRPDRRHMGNMVRTASIPNVAESNGNISRFCIPVPFPCIEPAEVINNVRCKA